VSATPEQIDEPLEPTVDDLRRLNAQAEPGAWWVDDFKVDDGFGQHYAYALANPMGKHIADTINGDLILIEQDDGPRRDMAGSRNLEFAAACVNYVRNVVLKADLATSGAQAERVRVLEGLLGDVLPDAERGAYLGEQCSHEYGDGREQPLELTISWDWQQSKPNTGGWGALQEDIDAWLAELRESEIDIPLLRARAALKAAP